MLSFEVEPHSGLDTPCPDPPPFLQKLAGPARAWSLVSSTSLLLREKSELIPTQQRMRSCSFD